MSKSENYNEFENGEFSRVSFDFRGYLFKVLNLWKFMLLCVGTAIIIAYFINVRKQNVYKLSSLISIENDQNPFFTANTSISFNWGGVSGKMSKTITAIKTRSHNEKVVDSLQYYMEYLTQGKYRKEDIYVNSPFRFKINKEAPQVLGYPIGIRFINVNEFEVFTEFESTNRLSQVFGNNAFKRVAVPVGSFSKKFSVGEYIDLPFLNGILNVINQFEITPGKEYFIQFLNFDSVVNKYKSGIIIEPESSSSPVLMLQLAGNNKAKIVDYLNATSAILSKSELERKNLYATNTIKFIDSSLAGVNNNLQEYTDEMNTFRRKNKVFDITEEIAQISDQLREYGISKEQQELKLNYLDNLEKYINTKTDFTEINAPTVFGITEINILNSISKIIELSTQRQNLEYTTKEGSGLFEDIDRKIKSEKNILLETIEATKKTVRIQLTNINNSVGKLESKLSNLPEDQQEYLKIQKKTRY
ncbi:hypothetical protein [Winogradskyella sp. R77965]|uniref:hypothetical protein n=1 Tax=Winogradskyella sp. R77965 TaxID=3093872 RepID=UPI0037DD86A4